MDRRDRPHRVAGLRLRPHDRPAGGGEVQPPGSTGILRDRPGVAPGITDPGHWRGKVDRWNRMVILDMLPIAISLFALLVSGWTLYATLVKAGTVRMTRPTIIFFGPDPSPNHPSKKVYLRFLLYATAKRGLVIESMFVRVRSRESVQTFPFWVYGEERLARGSGIHIGLDGVATNHHFALPRHVDNFNFNASVNLIEIVAKLIGDRDEIELGEFEVSLSEDQARQMRKENAGVQFDWGGDSKSYIGWVDTRPVAVESSQLTSSMIALLRDQLGRTME